MFRFADPNFLYLLILLPFLVALYLYSNYHRRQNIRKYGDPALLKGLMPTISKYRPDIKFWLTFADIGYTDVGPSTVRLKDGNGETKWSGSCYCIRHFKLYAGRRCDSQSFGQIKEIDIQTGRYVQ